MRVIIRNCDEVDWSNAVHLAKRFLGEFPDKFGVRDGCIYAYMSESFYVYRTGNSLIVRGTK